MPDLRKTLFEQDLGYLRILADAWQIELPVQDQKQALAIILQAMLDPNAVRESWEALPPDCQQALRSLLANKNRLLWPLFTKQNGPIREIGAGRRDRTRPDKTPASVTEILYYRGYLGRGFFDTPDGLLEFAYVPDDLARLLPRSPKMHSVLPARLASAAETQSILLASDQILDDTCTYLAALRCGMDNRDPALMQALYNRTPEFFRALLLASGLINDSDEPLPDQLKKFFDQPRGEALAWLAGNWLASSTCNDLRHVPGLAAEGDWTNDPLPARQAMLQYLGLLPAGEWWSIGSFVHFIQQYSPDFQRIAGDYDSWYLRDTLTGEYLRGYEFWDRVDGALIRYLITGPLHWLGFIDLAAAESGSSALAMCLSNWGTHLLDARPVPDLPPESDLFQTFSDAQVRAARLTSRSARYQLARFAEWRGIKAGAYLYRLTPKSLSAARQQSLTPQQLTALLRKHAQPTPPVLWQAIDRWEKRGAEANIQAVTILRLTSPEILDLLKKSKAARFLGDPLGPTTIIIKAKAAEKVRAILAELGFLADASLDE